MVEERGGHLYSTDDRYCIDYGAMIAWPGLLALRGEAPAAAVGKDGAPGAPGRGMELAETTCTQRYRTDEVYVTWRD